MPKAPRFPPNPTRVIDVLAYPAVQLLDVSGPVQVFASANDHVVLSPPDSLQNGTVVRVAKQGGPQA